MSDLEKNVKEVIKNDYILIEYWNIEEYEDTIKLFGKVQNHPRLENDSEVKTSNVVFINDLDKYIQTETGNKYKLGKPSDKFINEDIYKLLKELYDNEGGK